MARGELSSHGSLGGFSMSMMRTAFAFVMTSMVAAGAALAQPAPSQPAPAWQPAPAPGAPAIPAAPAMPAATDASANAEGQPPPDAKEPKAGDFDAGGQVRLPNGPDEAGKFATFNWIALDAKAKYYVFK